MNDPVRYPTYRQGRHQKQNVYRHTGPDTEGTYIGVFFDPEDARLTVDALNLWTVSMADARSTEHDTCEPGCTVWGYPCNADESPGEPETTPEYVWLVASALEPGSRAHAVPALAITGDTPKYRELLLDTLCSRSQPRSLVLIDFVPGQPEFKQCTRCVKALERKPA